MKSFEDSACPLVYNVLLLFFFFLMNLKIVFRESMLYSLHNYSIILNLLSRVASLGFLKKKPHKKPNNAGQGVATARRRVDLSSCALQGSPEKCPILETYKLLANQIPRCPSTPSPVGGALLSNCLHTRPGEGNGTLVSCV